MAAAIEAAVRRIHPVIGQPTDGLNGIVASGYQAAMALHGGIDLGGTKIQAVAVDDDGGLLGAARHPTPTAGGPEDVTRVLAQAIDEAAAAAGVATADLAAVGVGSPGKVDDDAGTVTGARNLPGWEGGFDLRAALGAATGAPIALGNDVQAGALAEFELGAGRPYGSMIAVFWGTGVGGGIVLDGEVWRGRGAAGEIGHVVVKQGGARCPCGRRGCLEAYAGRGAMEARAREELTDGGKTRLFKIMEERGRTRLTSGVWARALRDGDSMAERLIERAVEALGTGIASAINLLDLEAVVIGGGLGDKLGEPGVERIRAAMLPHLFRDERPPAVHLAALGDLGGATGAALLARAIPTNAPRA
jgi:glucokinase